MVGGTYLVPDQALPRQTFRDGTQSINKYINGTHSKGCWCSLVREPYCQTCHCCPEPLAQKYVPIHCQYDVVSGVCSTIGLSTVPSNQGSSHSTAQQSFPGPSSCSCSDHHVFGAVASLETPTLPTNVCSLQMSAACILPLQCSHTLAQSATLFHQGEGYSSVPPSSRPVIFL